jgi:hypothetical protein
MKFCNIEILDDGTIEATIEDDEVSPHEFLHMPITVSRNDLDDFIFRVLEDGVAEVVVSTSTTE